MLQTPDLTLHQIFRMEKEKASKIQEFSISTIPGYRGLMYAIIERAMSDSVGIFGSPMNRDSIKREIVEARQWLGLEVGNGWGYMRPFSFLWICEHLNLPPEKVIRKVREIEKRMLQCKHIKYIRDK